MLLCDSYNQDMPKTRFSIDYPRSCIPLSSENQRWILSSTSQTETFYLYKNMLFEKLCFQPSRHNPDKPVLWKNVPFFEKMWKIKWVISHQKLARFTAIYQVLNRYFSTVTNPFLWNFVDSVPFIRTLMVCIFPKRMIYSDTSGFSNSCFSVNTGFSQSMIISVKHSTLLLELSIELLNRLSKIIC